MGLTRQILSITLTKFVDSERSGGFLLLSCAAIALLLTNSALGAQYLALWQTRFMGISIEHWINDGLMAIFFFYIGLELEREIYIGELSSLRDALLPICAAIGGMAAPALIHLSLNAGSPTQAGFGIPMATDIAFVLGILAVLGNRIPGSLKVFVVAYAVMDDLGAIVVIAAFYTTQISAGYLVSALALWALLIVLNLLFRVMFIAPYLIGGALMWFLMLKSGVHATIAGVALAFAIPFSPRDDDQESPSYKLEAFLHKPVAFIILPFFALANAGVVVGSDWVHNVTTSNSIGIMGGLILGKPLGLVALSLAAVASGLCSLPAGLNWRHVLGAGILGGIGFTMSIFVTNLAFVGNTDASSASKMAIFLASLTSGAFGFLCLRFLCGSEAGKSYAEPLALEPPNRNSVNNREES